MFKTFLTEPNFQELQQKKFYLLKRNKSQKKQKRLCKFEDRKFLCAQKLDRARIYNGEKKTKNKQTKKKKKKKKKNKLCTQKPAYPYI